MIHESQVARTSRKNSPRTCCAGLRLDKGPEDELRNMFLRLCSYPRRLASVGDHCQHCKWNKKCHAHFHCQGLLPRPPHATQLKCKRRGTLTRAKSRKRVENLDMKQELQRVRLDYSHCATEPWKCHDWETCSRHDL